MADLYQVPLHCVRGATRSELITGSTDVTGLSAAAVRRPSRSAARRSPKRVSHRKTRVELNHAM